MRHLLRAFSLLCLIPLSCGGGGGDGDAPAPSGNPDVTRTFTITLPLFAATSAWRQNVVATAVHANSAAMILVTYRILCGDLTGLNYVPNPPIAWPFALVNYDGYSVAVFRAGLSTQDALLQRYDGTPGGVNGKITVNGDNTVTVPSCDGTVRSCGPSGTDADGHLVLFNPGTGIEWDFWQPTTAVDGSGNSLGGGQYGTQILRSGAIDTFDVAGSGSNVPNGGYGSARASGVPLLAGLLLPEDVQSGIIQHALAYAIPGPRSGAYSPPATSDEADFYNTNPNAIAQGQRIRMRPALVDAAGNPLNEAALSPITQMVIAALRTYGAYLVDNAGGFGFYAEDWHTAALNLTDDQVNALIGQPSGTPLPAGQTKWQIVLARLNQELEDIPFAYGTWQSAGDPASTATVTTPNYEVIEDFVP